MHTHRLQRLLPPLSLLDLRALRFEQFGLLSYLRGEARFVFQTLSGYRHELFSGPFDPAPLAMKVEVVLERGDRAGEDRISPQVRAGFLRVIFDSFLGRGLSIAKKTARDTYDFSEHLAPQRFQASEVVVRIGAEPSDKAGKIVEEVNDFVGVLLRGTHRKTGRRSVVDDDGRCARRFKVSRTGRCGVSNSAHGRVVTRSRIVRLELRGRPRPLRHTLADTRDRGASIFPTVLVARTGACASLMRIGRSTQCGLASGISRQSLWRSHHVRPVTATSLVSSLITASGSVKPRFCRHPLENFSTTMISPLQFHPALVIAFVVLIFFLVVLPVYYASIFFRRLWNSGLLFPEHGMLSLEAVASEHRSAIPLGPMRFAPPSPTSTMESIV